MSLIGLVRRTLRRYHLAGPDTRVLAAVSGGPDSIALLHLLRQLHDAGELVLVAVAHFDHQLRPESRADARFCAGVAESMGLPFHLDGADVRADAARSGRSLEDAAHVLRYDFYVRAADASHADVVALGHTQDDQAETFLLRLVRGAGSRGLSAMHPRNDRVIRPLLECSRADLRAFLDAAGIRYVHDATNDDVGVPRNRVRAELLPLLIDRFNPRVVEALAGAAELARADEEYLAGLADDWLEHHATQSPSGAWRVSAGAALAVPRAVAWRGLHRLLSRASSTRPIGVDDVRRTWAVVIGESEGFDGPGQRVQREGGLVVLTGRPAGSAGRRPSVSAGRFPEFSHLLPVPGEAAIPEIGCVMSAEVLPSAENAPEPNGATVVVPKQMVAGGLAVRSRRPGDRIRRAAGTRKVQDLLVDRKVPREDRERIPIVTDRDGRIVWVVGHALDRDFQVTDPVQAVVILRLKAVGGSC